MRAYVKIANLVDVSDSDLGGIFTRMGQRLADSGATGRIQFRIHDLEGRHYWVVALDGPETRVSTSETEDSDLEVIIRKDTWWQIATGEFSPVEAFLQGKMRLRGDVDLAKRIVRGLAATDGRVDFC